MYNQGYSNELSKNEMLNFSNTTSDSQTKSKVKNVSMEVNSMVKNASNNKNFNMSTFHAFSKIIDDDATEEGDESKCST